MANGKKRQKGTKLGGFLAGAILIMGIAFFRLTPSYAMDAMTRSELDELSGKAGINMVFRDAVTVEASFHSLSIGDTDGWDGNAANDNAGWLVLIGTGSTTGYLRTTIPAESILTVDAAVTGASSCAVAGGAPYAGIVVPANTPFFSFSLTDTDIGLQTPETVWVKLTHSATIAATSMETVGFMNVTNLMIDKDDIKSTCYIWARP
jgi:hypothetical protein